MTVSAETPITNQLYTGPGDYDFNFTVYGEEDLVIKHLSTAGVLTTLALGVHFTVAIDDPQPGGTVTTFNYAPTTGTIIIASSFALSQSTEWEIVGRFNTEQIETDLDRVYLILQQMDAKIEEEIEAATWVGDWITAIAYTAREIVKDTITGNVYLCLVEHTSGTLTTDISNGYWVLIFDVEAGTDAQAAAEIAQAAAEIAQAAAETAHGLAEDAADVALGSANFEGTWSAGTYTLPSSVRHNEDYWILVAASTTGEPGVSSDWEVIATHPNPNLLINPGFTINEAGYVDGAALSGTDYCFDMWRDYGAVGHLSVSVSSALATYGEITLDNSDAAAGAILQKNDDILQYPDGTDITISCTLISGDATLSGLGFSNEVLSVGFNSFTCALDSAVDHLYLTVAAGENAIIKELKLETGGAATGYTKPDRLSELRKCQEYYYKLHTETGSSIGQYMVVAPGYWISPTVFAYTIQTPVRMRGVSTDYTLDMSELYVISDGNSYVMESHVIQSDPLADKMVIQCSIASGTPAPTALDSGTLFMTGNGLHVVLDARY